MAVAMMVGTDHILLGSDKTTSTLRSHQEPAVHFHHLIVHTIAQSCSTTLPEEQCGADTNLDPCQVNANTDPGTTSKWNECRFLFSRQRLIQEAKTIEAGIRVRCFGLLRLAPGVLTEVDSTRLMGHDVWCKPGCSHRHLLGCNSRPPAYPG